MYKGEVSLFSFSRAKGLREGKARLHPVNKDELSCDTWWD